MDDSPTTPPSDSAPQDTAPPTSTDSVEPMDVSPFPEPPMDTIEASDTPPPRPFGVPRPRRG